MWAFPSSAQEAAFWFNSGFSLSEPQLFPKEKLADAASTACASLPSSLPVCLLPWHSPSDKVQAGE